MYTKVLIVLFLCVYATSEDDGHNENEEQQKENVESYPFSNHSSESEVQPQPTSEGNKRKSVIRRTYDSNIFKSLATIKENNDQSQTDGNADGELQVPMFFISLNSKTKSNSVTSSENNSSELIQADGTYNMQHVVRPPIMNNQNNQYHMQHLPSYSNWGQVDNRYNLRNDPRLSSSSSQQQYSHSRSSYSEHGPYQAQRTYNVQYNMLPYQQRKQISIEHQRQVALNNWRRLNYKHQASVDDPRIYNQPEFPSVDRRYTVMRHYPNPPKPPNTFSHPEQTIHTYGSPPSSIRGNAFAPPQEYRNAFPPQSVNSFHVYPPQSDIDPYVRYRTTFINRMKGYITFPPYTPELTPPTWKTPPPVYPPPSPNGTPPPHTPSCPTIKTSTSKTPPWPSVTPPIITSTWSKSTPPSYSPSQPPKVTPPGRTTTPRSRTKSYTPPGRKFTPPTRYTPPGSKVTPSTRYTPPGKKVTPSTRYTPPGKKVTPSTRYTPPGQKVTPPTRYTPPGWRTPPTRRRTKGYTY